MCDKYEPLLDRVKERAEEYGTTVALYNNFEDFFKHDMDAVVLANYADEHTEYAIRCLDAGMHVMSEVLPSATMAEAVALIEAVERSGRVYAYAENYCYMKPTFEMWKRYEEGAIGEVLYCEGEYVHDCSSIWADITYGDPTHWRNRIPATFYCTHSLGPLLTITGRRPVSVVGFETPLFDAQKQKDITLVRTSGIEMVTLDNGAVCKSLHGAFKMEPGSVNYQVYGKLGMMESKRYNDEEFNLYVEDSDPNVFCKGEWEKYDPKFDFGVEVKVQSGHGGSDFYPTHFFIEKILGRPNGKYSIDVYTAVDMGICGILAYRSALNGSAPVKVPNLRNKEERDAYRNDNASTNPATSTGDELWPKSIYGDTMGLVPENYEHVKEMWIENQKTPLKK